MIQRHCLPDCDPHIFLIPGAAREHCLQKLPFNLRPLWRTFLRFSSVRITWPESWPESIVPTGTAAAMKDPIQELRNRASILQRQINAGHPLALARLRQLPEFRLATEEDLRMAGPGIGTSQCLSLAAASLGFQSWSDAEAAISGSSDISDFGTLLCPPRCGGHESPPCSPRPEPTPDEASPAAPRLRRVPEPSLRAVRLYDEALARAGVATPGGGAGTGENATWGSCRERGPQ